jgi:hypothetical protein
MSVVPAVKFSPAQAGATSEMKNTTLGSFVLAIAIPLAMAACSGGDGLAIGPVDHSCHINPQEGQGSGCAF